MVKIVVNVFTAIHKSKIQSAIRQELIVDIAELGNKYPRVVPLPFHCQQRCVN